MTRLPTQRTTPTADALPVAFALAALGLHLTCLTQYGWFRDELYYMASTRHLAWGYVDHPPLSIALLTLVRTILGESLAAIRIVAALFGAITVFLTGRLARAAGGGAFATSLACLSALLAPVYLAVGHFYSMNAIEMALWPAASLLLLRALHRLDAGTAFLCEVDIPVLERHELALPHQRQQIIVVVRRLSYPLQQVEEDAELLRVEALQHLQLTNAVLVEKPRDVVAGALLLVEDDTPLPLQTRLDHLKRQLVGVLPDRGKRFLDRFERARVHRVVRQV